MRCGREAILKAAIRVFADKGYSGASIREICRAAGITKSVLYYHFRSKEHLYEELLLHSFSGNLKAMLKASKKQGSLRDRLVRIVHHSFLEARANRVNVQFLLRMVFSPEVAKPEFDYVREMERERRLLARVLKEGGVGRTSRGRPRDLATLLMGMDLMTILEHLYTGRATLTKRRAEMNVDVLLRGCLERSCTGAGRK